MKIEVIGIDHIYISVSQLARSEKYYDQIMPLLGFKKNTFPNERELHIQYYNRHFGYVLRPARAEAAPGPLRPGLHHICFRVEDCATVDWIAQQFGVLRIEHSTAQLYPEYAPDYYAIFFSDPDGIRLEITNYRQERRKRFENWEDA